MDFAKNYHVLQGEYRMNKSNTTRLLASISLVAILLAVVFAAFQALPAQAGVRTVTLTIDNRAPSGISLYLTGPGRYYLQVPKETRQSFTVNQGKYEYTIKGCGMTVKNELDLSQDTILINPVCGGNIHVIPKDLSKIDLSADIKVVPVTISSELAYKTFVILTGPSTYVFTLKPNQDLAVTIGRGAYKVRYYACGVNVKKVFQAQKNTTLTLRCP
jgi:hypothetical protein